MENFDPIQVGDTVEANFGDKLVCWSCRDSLRWKYAMVNGKVQLR